MNQSNFFLTSAMPIAKNKTLSSRISATIGLIVMGILFCLPFLAEWQTRRQLSSPLIPQATVDAIVADGFRSLPVLGGIFLLALVAYAFKKNQWVVALALLMLISTVLYRYL